MSSRWLSTFSLLGILLIALGIVGFIHPRFVYDPGQMPTGTEHWYYLAAGILMLANGLLAPAPVKSDKKTAVPAKADAPQSEARTP